MCGQFSSHHGMGVPPPQSASPHPQTRVPLLVRASPHPIVRPPMPPHWGEGVPHPKVCPPTPKQGSPHWGRAGGGRPPTPKCVPPSPPTGGRASPHPKMRAFTPNKSPPTGGGRGEGVSLPQSASPQVPPLGGVRPPTPKCVPPNPKRGSPHWGRVGRGGIVLIVDIFRGEHNKASRREKAPRSGKCTPQGAGPGQRPGALRPATGSRGSALGKGRVIQLLTVTQRRQNSHKPYRLCYTASRWSARGAKTLLQKGLRSRGKGLV